MSQTALFRSTQRAADAPTGIVQRELQRWLSSLRKNALQFQEVSTSLGAVSPSTGTFTITDPEINKDSRLLVIAKPDEENALEPINVVGVTPAVGSALVEWQAPEDGAEGTRYFWYGMSG